MMTLAALVHMASARAAIAISLCLILELHSRHDPFGSGPAPP